MIIQDPQTGQYRLHYCSLNCDCDYCQTGKDVVFAHLNQRVAKNKLDVLRTRARAQQAKKAG